MVITLTEDLSHSFPLLGMCFKSSPRHNIWALASLQIGFCITTSLFISYFFYNRFHFGGKKSWTRAINILNPIRKRLQNLEKERAIWKYYLHWMEDYFFVYCDLLKFLNKTTLDVEKVYRDHLLGLSQIASSGVVSESAANISKTSVTPSNLTIGSIPSEDDLQLIASFAQFLAQMASEEAENPKTDAVKPIFDPDNLFISEVTSGDETNDEFNENGSESLPLTLDEELKVSEIIDMEFFSDENNFNPDEELSGCSEYSTRVDELES